MSNEVHFHSSFFIAHSSFAMDSFASLGMTKKVCRMRYNDKREAEQDRNIKRSHLLSTHPTQTLCQ